MKTNEWAGVGNHTTAKFWEYDTRTGRRMNLEPRADEMPWISPYATNNDNPILHNDPNGDFPWAALGRGVIRVAYRLNVIADAIGSAFSNEPLGLSEVGTLKAMHANEMKRMAEQANPQKKEKQEVKSRSEGAKNGERAGKDFTKKGKEEVWQKNKDEKGSPKCENCGKDLNKPPQSKKGEPTPSDAGQVDHIQPKSQGGDGDPSNGQLLCPSCNQAKGTTPPLDSTFVKSRTFIARTSISYSCTVKYLL